MCFTRYVHCIVCIFLISILFQYWTNIVSTNICAWKFLISLYWQIDDFTEITYTWFNSFELYYCFKNNNQIILNPNCPWDAYLFVMSSFVLNMLMKRFLYSKRLNMSSYIFSSQIILLHKQVSEEKDALNCLLIRKNRHLLHSR